MRAPPARDVDVVRRRPQPASLTCDDCVDAPASEALADALEFKTSDHLRTIVGVVKRTHRLHRHRVGGHWRDGLDRLLYGYDCSTINVIEPLKTAPSSSAATSSSSPRSSASRSSAACRRDTSTARASRITAASAGSCSSWRTSTPSTAERPGSAARSTSASRRYCGSGRPGEVYAHDVSIYNPTVVGDGGCTTWTMWGEPSSSRTS